MRIKGTCARCGREFLVREAIDNGGHCPSCGQPFNAHYTAVLASTLREAEIAGSVIEDALNRLVGMEGALELDEESILEPLRQPIRATRRGKIRPRR